MKKSTKIILLFGLIALLTAAIVITANAVSGAAFTTFNAHVDGSGKDVCKNSVINCNIYGAKEYVWLNGGPTANGLGPDGDYFFAVLEPGGQPNPNDQGAVADKNLSDDYDCYWNRTFTVTDGEVSTYTGDNSCPPPYDTFTEPHWLDSGKNGKPGEPNGMPPYIRLFPYSDTTNPGGVYILAICSLEDGYPVEPRDCKYDAFKVKKGKMDYSFYLAGMKFEDMYADGIKDAGDTGLGGWTIIISGTGPDGLPFYAEVITEADGSWEWFSDVYTFTGKDKPGDVTVQVCEDLASQAGDWVQSFPSGDGCHNFTFTPTGFNSFLDLDFGNWLPVEVSACKDRQNYDGSTTPIAGWEVWLTIEGVKEGESQYTDSTGCYTWTGLTPGISYDVHEAEKPGWEPLAGVSKVWPWEDAKSGASLSYTFVNQPLEGCTPGFWQGGNDFETAGGKWYWNVDNDLDWAGLYSQPFSWYTPFDAVFSGSTETMWHFVNPNEWEVNDDFHKAARSLVAGYLNASWGIGYAYSTVELEAMWTAAYNGGTLLELHTELDAANNAYYRPEPPAHCPISASQN